MNTTHDTPAVLRSSMREHVLAPLSAARRTVDREVTEVEAERRAFERFGEQVAGVEPASVADPTDAPTPRTYAVESRSRAVERVRSAYRATVMSVDHYDDVYGEALDEHVAAELSAEVAAALQPERPTPFTEQAKAVVLAAVRNAVAGRETYLDALDGERDSLTEGRDALEALLDEQDGPRVPDWYRGDFTARLDDVAEARQARLKRRPVASTDGHELCAALYHEYEWTYPVLTAVTRLRRTVV